METFGERLKNYRKAKGWTQQKLAEEIGVSDKTVSRWESDGGYPDVPVLVPLARALGVTVDDLLDGEKPARTLTRTDGQNLLSFAFAVGGGILYFLLSGFMPGALAYGVYLVCLIYGVYLQKYDTCRDRRFFLGEAAANLVVNLTAAIRSLLALAAIGFTLYAGVEPTLGVKLLSWGYSHKELACGLFILLALALTALTQYLVVKKGFDGMLPLGKGERRLHIHLQGPGWRRLLPALVPLIAAAYWLPPVWERLWRNDPTRFMNVDQDHDFLLLLLALAILAALPLLKGGLRRWVLPAWAMTAACWAMTGMREYHYIWSEVTGRYIPYAQGLAEDAYHNPIGWGTWSEVVFGGVLAVLWLLSVSLKLTDREEA